MRHLGAAAVVIVLVLGMLGAPCCLGQTSALAQSSSATTKATGVGVSSVQRFFYLGVDSCGASTCHGSVTPRNAPRSGIRQTEYTQWLATDKHAKAYEV